MGAPHVWKVKRPVHDRFDVRLGVASPSILESVSNLAAASFGATMNGRNAIDCHSIYTRTSGMIAAILHLLVWLTSSVSFLQIARSAIPESANAATVDRHLRRHSAVCWKPGVPQDKPSFPLEPRPHRRLILAEYGNTQNRFVEIGPDG